MTNMEVDFLTIQISFRAPTYSVIMCRFCGSLYKINPVDFMLALCPHIMTKYITVFYIFFEM